MIGNGNCCGIAGSICNNLAQFGALRRIAALSRDQYITIRHAAINGLLHYGGINLQQFGVLRRAWTDWCRSAGPICNISAQFGVVRPIVEHSRDQSDCCTFTGSICNNSAHFGALRLIAALSRVQSVTIQLNSAHCDGLVHFCGINLQHFGTIRRAATDCSTFAEPICNDSARCNGLLHFHRINL